MAPPSPPRRSSRARATNPQSQQSSVSSGASSRHERSTRSVTKPSSNKSTPSLSLSSESIDELDDTLLSRRRKRGLDEETYKSSRLDIFEMTGSEDLQDEEDEAVRCICGAEEYPGRPPVDGPDADYFAAIELTEEVTGFFVQCDICKVWQHGACVGIFSAESSPDEYFCEQCRKDLHKIYSAGNGQKYSKYLPLHRPSRAPSRAASIAKEGTRSPKNGPTKTQKPAVSQTSKRRSTMNSRDRAYEDEQLLRAIEASKEDAPPDVVESVTRRTKRGRSDSEESVAVTSQESDDKLISSRNNPSVKRQRTSSRSVSPPTEPAETPSIEPSDDESNTRSLAKKARNGKLQREKVEKLDKPEKDEKERLRQDAATKRKGRAERRRVEGTVKANSHFQTPPANTIADSDPPEDVPTATKPPIPKIEEPPTEPEPPAEPQAAPDTPPTSHPTVGSSHKRGARNNLKKGKGKNQYTRDRDGETSESPARSMSRDIQKNGDEPPTLVHAKPLVTDHRSNARSKTAMPNKLSMVDMKRRVGAIMDFISRTQVDLAAESYPLFNTEFSSGQTSPRKTPGRINGNSEAQLSADERETSPEPSQMKDFKELNCMEMMDVLTRDMVKWQNHYA
ncbi:hypothetical protein BGZ63DRAFT_412106 [Mariannaea sp. PMI_226]|nr:hypothetical protein BGZ63DRAFT_412106 [Mariannaea sp. PMI_226]